LVLCYPYGVLDYLDLLLGSGKKKYGERGLEGGKRERKVEVFMRLSHRKGQVFRGALSQALENSLPIRLETLRLGHGSMEKEKKVRQVD